MIWRRIGFSYHPLRAASVLGGAAIIAAICAQSAVAWYAHDEGKHHAAQDDLEAALGWYVYAADIDPGTTGYHDSIARTAMQLFSDSGKSEWLVTAAEEEAVAKKLNPLDGRFAFRLGTIYRLMAAQTLPSAQRAELLSKASEAFSEAIRLDPYSPFNYFELAQIRLAEGRVEEALALLTTATTHEPNFLPGRALLAELSLRAGIPGDYQQEYDAIKAVRSKYAHRELSETERRFLDVDLYPLGTGGCHGVETMKVWRDQLSFWLMSAAMMGLLIALQVSLKPWQETDKKLERLIYLPDAEYLKIASLGYRELLADLLWIQSIQVMGEKKVSESSGRWLYRALDIITTLDPKFVRAYEAGGLALTTLVVLPEESNQLMMKGMQHNPTEWKLPFLIGINYYYELYDDAKAAEYMSQASRLPGAPSSLATLAANLYVSGHSPQQAVDLLAALYREGDG